MLVTKSVRIPVHYDTTGNKTSILDNLTARITYCIRLISELVNRDTVTDRATIRKLVKGSDIIERTGLSSGFIDQCIDKVIWTWKSNNEHYDKWNDKVLRAQERLFSARDDKEREKAEKSLNKLMSGEPSVPDFEDKTSCRFDYRTGSVEEGIGKFSPLWIRISTLQKNYRVDIPLNPSHYHMNQLKNSKINDFEIIKHNKKYYIHVSITKVIEDKPISSIGGGDQGLNRTIAVVLLDNPLPREEHIMDAAKRQLLDKYDAMVASLQEAGKYRKLRELRDKRENVSVYCDWLLANRAAEFTEEALIVIGDTKFRQTQYRSNGMPGLRKRMCKWSYSRQRKYIALKRAERGYPTLFDSEYNTSRKCCKCKSMLTTRKWVDGYSWVLCHSCGAKIDADFNAAHNLTDKLKPLIPAIWVYNMSIGYGYVLRCRDDRLKVQMNTPEKGTSA